MSIEQAAARKPGLGRLWAQLSRWLRRPALRALLPLLIVLAIGCVFNQQGAFFQWDTHRALLREISVHGILACGMTVVIITGGIDLSVGSVLALCAVLSAVLMMPLGLPEPLSVALVLLVGLSAGVVSGALVAVSKIQAFIVTLAMMVFARGLAKHVSGGRKVASYIIDANGIGRTLEYPKIFELLDSRVLFDNLSIVTLLFLGSALLTWMLLSQLRVGRYLYAIGGNIEAARLVGVPVRASLIVAYALSGLFAAVAGICQAAQETQGDPETGLGYELDAIAMVVLGGTSLMGGRGHVGLTLIGALTLGYVQKILSLNAYSTETRLMLTGIILVLAVLFQRRFASAPSAG